LLLLIGVGCFISLPIEHGRWSAATATLLRRVSGHDFIRAELLAACHTRLGQIDEARSHADAALSIFPELRVSNFRLWKSFRNEADRQNLVGALR